MERLTRVLFLCTFVAIVATTVGKPLGASAQNRPFYVSVTDSKGDPKAGLTAADLSVEVNGKAAPVSSIAPAAEPVSIVVVTEGIRQDAISEIRKMMKAVVVGARAINPESRVGLMIEDGAAMPKMHTVTTDAQALDAEIARFFESSKNAPLLDSIMIAAQTLSYEKLGRRVIVAVTRGQEEAQTDAMSPVKITTAVRQSGAMLWALDLGGRDDANGAAEQRVLADVTAISGGRQERSSVNSISSLAEKIMATLRGQYAITLEDGLTPKSATPKVSSRDKDLKVVAPKWPAIK